MKTLDGKVVVITGAGSGIGRALALNAAAKGAILALTDVDEVGLLETLEHARTQTNREIRTDKLDVRDRDEIASYAASVRQKFGRVNVLINNAGVALHGDFAETSYAQFEWVMDINFWGVVNGTKEFLPHLIESGDGHVVNISSLFGLMGMPGQSAYNSSKFAVRGFTEALRLEMLIAKHPVEVSCVHPVASRPPSRAMRAPPSRRTPHRLPNFSTRSLPKRPRTRLPRSSSTGYSPASPGSWSAWTRSSSTSGCDSWARATRASSPGSPTGSCPSPSSRRLPRPANKRCPSDADGTDANRERRGLPVRRSHV